MKKTLPLFISLCCVGANATSVNYDLLGRKSSKMNSPMVYKNFDYSKMKKNDQQNIGSTLETKALAKQASGLNGGATAIVGSFEPKGYGFLDCSNSSSGCGNSIGLGNRNLSLTSYLNKANPKFIKNISHQKPRFSPDYAFVTAGPTRSNLSGFDAGEFSYNAYGNVTYTSSFNKNLQITYSPVSSVINNLNHNNLSKKNIGIYFDEEAVPVRLNPEVDAYAPFILADNASMDNFNSMPGYEMRASRMYRLVHMFSDLSAVYAVKGQPSNPASTANGPQIYMGLHAHGGNAKSSYSATAKNLDNYIYNNRTVEIVGAGNTAGNLSAKAFAVNAITVGALNTKTNKTASYSAKNLPKYCSNCDTYNKPEVENYSDFYTDDYYRRYVKSSQLYEYYPYYDGTEAAAGVTAGMISNMLSYNEFYKWHPEVVKAAVVNASLREPFKYDGIVFDPKDDYKTHHSYYFIGDVNKIMKNKEIVLHFGRGDLSYGHNSNVQGFCATIAWLNSGNDIANLGKLPQNFEIYGYKRPCNQNCYETLSGASLDDSSERNEWQKGSPYKSICVDSRPTDSTHGLSIRIVLKEEDTRSENYGQMVLGLDVKPFYN